MDADQARPRQARRALRVHPVRLLLDLMPGYWLNSERAISAPLALLQARRWLVDSPLREDGRAARRLETRSCSIAATDSMNCAKACPKNQPGEGYRRITMMVERHV